jgi:6-pyruvoyltetrahydropterin/6-carboxytetrahydropterin synthase
VYELKIKSDFSAAHNLRGYEGACEELHGHNWLVEIFVHSSVLNDIGLAIDFKQLKAYTKDILSRLDHKYLNDLEPFKTINPSSENISKYIFDELKKSITGDNVTVAKVTVYESLNASASYIAKG